MKKTINKWSDEGLETTFSGNLVKPWSIQVPETGRVCTGATGKGEIEMEFSTWLSVSDQD
jgi:hypothetical protein